MISAKQQSDSLPRRPRQAVSEVPASRVTPKPVPQSQLQDARAYQIEQLRRRYSPKETTDEQGNTSLRFQMVPSDPDFPFELDKLDCEVRVPATYPQHPPSLRVKNQNIPRGFAVNVETGWVKLTQERKGATLLALTNALDRKLEELLSEQEAATITFSNIVKDTRHLDQASSSTSGVLSPPAEPTASARRYVPEESFSKEQIAEAKARRAQEVRQLEARMSRLPYYHKSADGIVYTLPLDSKRRFELPAGLQAIKSVQLIIPLLYPLQSLRILLNDVESKDAEGVEELFAEKATEQKQMTLMSHLNYLAQNIHVLAKQAARAAAESAPVEPAPATDITGEKPKQDGAMGDKSHIRVIPRPPEWDFVEEDDLDESSDDDYSYDEDDDDDGGASLGDVAPAPATTTSQPVERGTALMLPSVELRGVELLQISSLSVNVKCERCKTVNEVTGLKDSAAKTASCKKCTAPFIVNFRPELVHANSNRAGFIDAAGCTVADLLPSTFVPTCATCSTPSPGLSSVRGETTTNVCRECHARFTFRIPEVRLLLFTASSDLRVPTTMQLPRRQRDDKLLGIQAGTPLPDRGACAHYRRSHRWFRFGCCGRAHACDRCHDAAEKDHAADEWAARMICGWCSREQPYRPESCAFCGRSVIGKRGNGYWEGGKGTRNRVLMRRGDKRKHRRVGGGEAAKEKKER